MKAKDILRWTPAKPLLFESIVAIVLLVLTYPMFEPDYSNGLDASYIWGFNWLFDNDYNTLTRLIYPYGPFLWLKLPTLEGHHFVLFLLFFFAAKFIFISQALSLLRSCGCGILVAVAAVIPGCIFANIDVFLVFDVAFLVLRWLEKRQWLWFLLASVIAVFTLTIKVSIGVQTCSILVVGWLWAFVCHKNYRQLTVAAFSGIASFVVVGLAVYHRWSTMLSAYIGIPHLVMGYSDALVLMPEHKLWSLIIFVLATIALMLLSDNRKTRLFCLLMILPLFATWKYSIVREDFWHFKQLIAFCSCLLFLLPSMFENRRLAGWGCGVLALSMLFVNLHSLRLQTGCTLTTVRPGNFINLLVHGQSFKAKWQDNIEKGSAARRLDNSVLEIIDNGTVDCYPWEDIYIAANNLKWQPSTAVQFGAGNSAWVNHRAAQNYANTSTAVDFVLLHRINYERENGLKSIDDRYLLNDEPEVLDSILNNYYVADTGRYGILLAKGRNVNKRGSTVTNEIESHWDEWIDLSMLDESFTRADLSTYAKFNGRLRSMLYKPDICSVDYRLADGRELTYRFSPQTARCGLWIGPMPQSYVELAEMINLQGDLPRPVAIRFRAKHPNWHRKEVILHFRND